MNSMVNENGVTFKTLEKEIYRLICEAGRERIIKIKYCIRDF